MLGAECQRFVLDSQSFLGLSPWSVRFFSALGLFFALICLLYALLTQYIIIGESGAFFRFEHVTLKKKATGSMKQGDGQTSNHSTRPTKVVSTCMLCIIPANPQQKRTRDMGAPKNQLLN